MGVSYVQKGYHVGACPRLGDKGIAPKPVSKRVLCRLCSSEGVKDTLLCKEHLEGYNYACSTLMEFGITLPARMLEHAIKQKKGSDNGKSNNYAY